MPPFSEALDLVHTALRSMEDHGQSLTASLDSLRALSVVFGEVPTVIVPADPAPSHERAPAALPATARPAPAIPVLPPLPPRAASIPAAPLAAGKAERLAAWRETVAGCVKCPHLAATRTQTVFGTGNPEAELMFVGEAPGEDEDRRGEPFVGRAGQLLTKVIETMGFTREQVFIANILKCRPNMPAGEAGNRKPTAEEMRTCIPYLEEQIAIIQPRVLVALGATAVEGLLGLTEAVVMGRVRNRWHEFKGIPLMPTYHPSYLLRNQSNAEKRKHWEDMLLVLTKLDRPIDDRQRTYFLTKS